MSKKNKTILRCIFLFAMICFIFPFFTVSCSNQEILKVDGIKTITGGTFNTSKSLDALGGSDTSGDKKSTSENPKMDPNIFAIIALAAAAAGLGLTFLQSKKSYIMTAVMGLVGFVSAILLRIDFGRLVNDSTKTSGKSADSLGMSFTIENKFGFYLLLFAFIAAVGFSLYMRKEKVPLSSPIPDLSGDESNYGTEYEPVSEEPIEEMPEQNDEETNNV